MTQLFAALCFVLISFGALRAQDLPPLPPADNSQASGQPALPPLPASSSDNASTPTALPPLPASSTDNATPTTLPPLPGGPTPTPSAGTTWSSPNLQVPASGPASAEAVPDVPKAAKPKKRPTMTPAEKYRYDHYRPNVIYGGWVWPRGGDVDDRLAWVSQEVLNALIPHGFTVAKEEGNYDGEDTSVPQWRQWTFTIAGSSVVSQVYIKPVRHRVWIRVGPSEPPADRSLAEVKAVQKEDLRMLKLLRKKFGSRLTPHHRHDWSAPYNYRTGTADE